MVTLTLATLVVALGIHNVKLRKALKEEQGIKQHLVGIIQAANRRRKRAEAEVKLARGLAHIANEQSNFWFAMVYKANRRRKAMEAKLSTKLRRARYYTARLERELAQAEKPVYIKLR